jgi:glutathione S-transferase
MALTLYAVPASHPSAAVERALQLKGLPYRRVDLPAVAHAAVQRVRFGSRTVPALRGDGLSVVGSRQIMRVLDGLAPDPPLLPADPAARARVEEAERWGDEVLQPAARRLVWFLVPHAAGRDAASFYEGSGLPMPGWMIAASARYVAVGAQRLNAVSAEAARSDVAALPGWIDRVDSWLADGTLGGAEEPNAADLQVLSSIRLLGCLEDTRPVLAGRPCDLAARALFPRYPGRLPALLPVEGVPAPAR